MSVSLTSKLPQIIAGMEAKASNAVATTAANIAADAKDIAPVDTGNLRNSIRQKMKGPIEAEVRVNAEYAGYVEYGTTRAPAQPYLTPAVEMNKDNFERAISQVVES